MSARLVPRDTFQPGAESAPILIMTQERLQKILARAGIAARRKSEELILAGRVRVNGQVVAELGSKADPLKDKIQVDGKRVHMSKPVYYVFHKPRGMVTTMEDPDGRECVGRVAKDLGPGVFPVGRLDYNTSGAIMLTNDGEMAQALSHPRYEVPRVYHVKVKGTVTQRTLSRWRKGIRLDRGDVARAEVFVLETGDNALWLEMELKQGLNRQIHRMVEACGLQVSKLKRISFAGLGMEGLAPGHYRPVTSGELARLKRDYLNPATRRQRAKKRNTAREAADRFSESAGRAGSEYMDESIGALPKRKIKSRKRGVVKVEK